MLTLVVLVLTECSAQAYIDPGTGSLILQVLVAGVLAALVTFKRWWRFLAGWLKKDGNDKSSKED